MSAPIDFRIERLRREPDNANVSVRDLLDIAIADIEQGDYKSPAKAIIIIIDDIDPDGDAVIETYRCGMTRPEELGWLEAAKQQVWARWTKDDGE